MAAALRSSSDGGLSKFRSTMMRDMIYPFVGFYKQFKLTRYRLIRRWNIKFFFGPVKISAGSRTQQ